MNRRYVSTEACQIHLGYTIAVPLCPVQIPLENDNEKKKRRKNILISLLTDKEHRFLVITIQIYQSMMAKRPQQNTVFLTKSSYFKIWFQITPKKAILNRYSRIL